MTGQRVVVIGASAAGLFAAAGAFGAGAEVTVLERDALTDEAQPRGGVPQGRQPHVFLYRGLLAAEQLLPGLRQDLLDAGAVVFDTADLAWLGAQGWTDRSGTSYQVFSTTRPLLEQIIRRRVEALAHVRIRSGAAAVGLRQSGAGWFVEIAERTEIRADLVIDASGRSSRLPHWLAHRFDGRLRTTEIDAKVGYATRVYAGDADMGDIPGVVLQATVADPTGGIAIPVEGGRWLIGALGMGNSRPPRDVTGFNAFLAGLRDPALSGLARRLEPISDVMVHRQTANTRRHYEEQRDWPDGLLVMGDAFCAFDPIYGQGIAVAACEAVLLRDAIRRGLKIGDSRRLLAQFAETVALPWSIATGTDLRFSTSEQDPPRSSALPNWWTTSLVTLSTHGNVRAASTLGGVYHLMMPTRQLLHPALVRDVRPGPVHRVRTGGTASCGFTGYPGSTTVGSHRGGNGFDWLGVILARARWSFEQLRDTCRAETEGADGGAPDDDLLADHVAGRRSEVGTDAGEEEQHGTKLVDRDDPPPQRVRHESEAAMADLDDGQVTGDQKQYAAEHLGGPHQMVVLLEAQVVDEDVYQADGEGQSAEEKHERRSPAGSQRLVRPPPPAPRVQQTVGPDGSRRVDLQHDRGIAAEREEDPADEEHDVDGVRRRGRELGQQGADGEQGPTHHERQRGHRVAADQPDRDSRSGSDTPDHAADERLDVALTTRSARLPGGGRTLPVLPLHPADERARPPCALHLRPARHVERSLLLGTARHRLSLT